MMMTPQPKVSVVIPNWNGLQHLPVCLDSLSKQTLHPHEIILVDSGSTDGSREFVGMNHPEVIVYPLDTNRGFAFAVNRGIERSTGEFIALVNNDTELALDWLAVLVDALQSDSKLGSVTGKMLNYFRRDIIDGAGDALTIAATPYTRGFGEPDDGRFNEREYVFAACAGAAVFLRAVFERVGKFDEDFVSYYEDVDLSFRSQLMGYTCLYVPEAVCYHKRGATSSTLEHFPIRMQERNLTAYYLKDFPCALLLRKIPLIAASRIRRVYRSMKAGVGKATWQGMFEGLALVPSMLRKRREVQRTRIVSIAYLNSFTRRVR